MLVYRSLFCIRKKSVEGLKKNQTSTEHALDSWQVVTNHILKYLKMLPWKTCSSAHQRQFDFMGISSARICSIPFVQLCLKSPKKHLVAWIYVPRNFQTLPLRIETNTHPFLFFGSTPQFWLQSFQEIQSNVTFNPLRTSAHANF